MQEIIMGTFLGCWLFFISLAVATWVLDKFMNLIDDGEDRYL